jgi:hypothetical protein
MNGFVYPTQNLIQRLKVKVERGEISIRSAAYKLYDAGWFNFVPSDREVLNRLHIVV